jgi:hypothetical protein
MAGLEDLLGSGGPLSPLELSASLDAQRAQNPVNYSAGPVGQMMGVAGARLAQDRALSTAQQLAQQQTGAMDDMGKYLSAEDPVRAAAADTGGNAVARWAMLRSSPEQVAQMRNELAQAGLQRAQTIRPTAIGGMVAGGGGGIPTLPGATGPGAPAPGQLAPGVPGAPTATSAGTGAAGGDPAVLPPGKARMDWLQRQPLAVQQAWLARLKQSQTAGGR